jgi:hypothetical protein
LTTEVNEDPVIWDMMPHSMAEVYKLFLISILMMEALSSSEMMAPIRLHGVTTRI